MKKYFVLFIFLLLFGCTSIKTKKSIGFSDDYQSGMTKTDFTALHGMPYKESFYYDKDNVLHENLYYKEVIYLQIWYEINYICHFENSILISIEQKEEKRLYEQDCKCK